MSSDESPRVPPQRHRREAVREKAQQVQAKQSRARVARRVALGVGVVAVVAVTATVVTWAFASTAGKPQLSPANISDDGFTVTSVSGVAIESTTGSAPDDAASATPVPSGAATPNPTAAPAVDIRVYVDYLSSGSREFQLANVAQLSKWITQDAATLTYYPVSMLTAKSNGTKYSLRAASAAACVATHAPDSFFAFNDALLRQQPAVDADGLTDDELATLAIASGAPDPKVVRSCIETESFASWAKGATDRALQGLPDTDAVALTATPTVLVNGMPYVGALDDPKEFAQFVLTIASDAYYQTASPTPTAAPSATAAPTPTATP